MQLLAAVRQHALERLRSDETSIDAKIDSISLLGRGIVESNIDLTVLQDLLTAQSPIEIQSAVVKQMCNHFDPSVFDLLFARWPVFTETIQQLVVDHALNNKIATNRLLSAIEEGRSRLMS